MKEVDIGFLRPATITQVIAEVVGIGILRPSTIPLVITEYILVVMLVEVDIGHNRSDTLTLEIWEQDFMLKVEVDIGIRPYTLPPITPVTMVYC